VLLVADRVRGNVELDSAVREWRFWSLWRHGSALFLIVVAAILRFGPFLMAPAPLWDELSYFDAAALWAAGESPFRAAGYFYPSFFAATIASAIDAWGLRAALLGLRALNLAGTALLVWFALSFCPTTYLRRLILGVLLVVSLPGIDLALETGNISPLIVALIFFGIVLARHFPLGSGLVLGLSLVLKPLAGPTLAAVLCPPSWPRRVRLCAGVVAVISALILPWPFLTDLLALGQKPQYQEKAVSFHLALVQLGLPLSWPVVALAVGALTLIAGRWARSGFRLLALATVALVPAAPPLWTHTLLVTLPVQIMALALAHHRLVQFGLSRFRFYEISLIAALCATAHSFRPLYLLGDLHPSFLLVGMFMTVLAPVGLGAYVLATTENL
jgi:hypothetical protein